MAVAEPPDLYLPVVQPCHALQLDWPFWSWYLPVPQALQLFLLFWSWYWPCGQPWQLRFAVDEPPDGGVPIISQELANALVDGQREFDAGEWASLGIDAPVAENSYVEVDAAVFRPLSRRERCRDRANLAKDVCQVANSHWIAPRHDFERATNFRWRPRADQPVADLRYAAEDAQRCASRTANVRSVDNASTCASVPVDRCDEYFDQCPTGFRHNFRELGLRWVRVGSADGTCAPDGCWWGGGCWCVGAGTAIATGGGGAYG